jgi:hypothetical protein
VSVIDTALLACGALTAGQYLGPWVQELAEELAEGIDWP